MQLELLRVSIFSMPLYNLSVWFA